MLFLDDVTKISGVKIYPESFFWAKWSFVKSVPGVKGGAILGRGPKC
jgi:hypothetical protein